MDSLDAIRTLQSMGLRVREDAGAFQLRVDDHCLELGAEPDWTTALQRAGRWLDSLGEDAGRDGETLVARREAVGFTEAEAFCAFTGLDCILVEEAEGGLMPPLPVHLRILEWLESGKLSRNQTARP